MDMLPQHSDESLKNAQQVWVDSLKVLAKFYEQSIWFYWNPYNWIPTPTLFVNTKRKRPRP